MSKRFCETEIWKEDWFLVMPYEYKLFWHYMLANCDHAGVFRVNLMAFCGLVEVKVTSKSALNYFNGGKQRIRIISESVWFIEDFFVFQYGHILNMNNRVHESIQKAYIKHNIQLGSLRGLKEIIQKKDKTSN